MGHSSWGGTGSTGRPADTAHQLMDARIQALEVDNERLRKALSERLQQNEKIKEQVQNLQCALNFWLPCVPEGCRDEKIIDRIFHDAYLLGGYEGQVVDTAEELKWVTMHAVPQSEPIDTVSGNEYSTVHGKDESGTTPGTAREAREDGAEAV